MKETLLISECLLGIPCRYDGGSKGLDAALLTRLSARYHLLPVCPEQLGGLETPRAPSERQGERVISDQGRDVTAQYARGAAISLALAEQFQCKKALLKQRSPSCGKGEIYDGTFSGTLVPRDGITSALLTEHGIEVFGEDRAEALLIT